MTGRDDDEFRRLLTGEQPTITAAEPVADTPAGAPATGATPLWRVGSALDTMLERTPEWLRTGGRWAGVVGVMAVAAATRLTGLDHPGELVFDETYYVKDAWALWNLGYESQWQSDADEQWAEGRTDGWTGMASFAVHPPLGKWLIGLGLAATGPADPASWRIATALAGIALVALVMVAAWLLTRSGPVTTITGFLLTIDGNGIVMSRVALLDGFLALFVLTAFICILLDRAHTARTGALWWRPWLLAAGVALGAALAVKWNGIWFVAAFGLVSVLADPNIRDRALELVKRAGVNLLLLLPITVVTYTLTWSAWFAGEDGYQRGWAETGTNAWSGFWAWVPLPVQSWLHLHEITYGYHVSESTAHPYMAPAWTWLALIRPTSMWYESSSLGDPGCAVTSCGASILDVPNPLIWGAAVAAIVYCIVRVIRRREWQVAAVLTGFAAGYLPWLAYPERTVYQFYTIAFQAFLLLALAIAIRSVLGTAEDERSRRVAGIWTVAASLVLVTAVSVYFWPVWTGMQVPFDFLASHWWLPGWR
ncbi:MAG TPA: phospholipid carrier-dependent glycosyltransferase [Microbacteriaceae bacterium]|nr:phospholipid carrier-dependent glycosyltransferase [Microbacteriaceae bacterium]